MIFGRFYVWNFDKREIEFCKFKTISLYPLIWGEIPNFSTPVLKMKKIKNVFTQNLLGIHSSKRFKIEMIYTCLDNIHNVQLWKRFAAAQNRTFHDISLLTKKRIKEVITNNNKIPKNAFDKL